MDTLAELALVLNDEDSDEEDDEAPMEEETDPAVVLLTDRRVSIPVLVPLFWTLPKKKRSDRPHPPLPLSQVIEALAKSRANLYNMSDKQWHALLSADASQRRCERLAASLFRITDKIRRKLARSIAWRHCAGGVCS